MYEELTRELAAYDQQQLLAHWDSLSTTEKSSLAEQIRGIDFALMKTLCQDEDHQIDWAQLSSRAQSPPAFRLPPAKNPLSAKQAVEAGEQALRAGRVGVILVAGGQGSRLGFEHPKGLYPIGPLSQRTLLQMHIEQVHAISRKFGVSVPVYLMTSPATHDETIAFLQQHDHFGYPAQDVEVFCQGSMPAIDATTGKLLLASPGSLFLSPDGHGGTLAALKNNGCLQDMQARGISELYYFQVDNPLAGICQSDLIGYHLLSKSEMTTQVVGKQDPLEKVGNVVLVDGKMMVIEYSDLPDELADRQDDAGSPIFWAGSIAVHVFDVDFLRRAVEDAESLPFHRARKNVPFIDERGSLVNPEGANAIKFERFIFDLLPMAQNPIVVEAEASEVFAPLKNASGAPKDTPEATRAAIVAKHTRMLQAAGASVEPGTQVEINPLFALDVEELAQRTPKDFVVAEDRYFEP